MTTTDILVLIAGIADPKKPLAQPLTLAGMLAARATQPLLSPFDEAALELALKLRDADAAVRITALVAGPGAADPLLRTVASLRIDRVIGIETIAVAPWNGAAVADALADAALSRCREADVRLIGREFGDFDDGTVPAALAARLGARYLALATRVERSADSVRVVRQRAGGLERVETAGSLVASITNDTGNRLRHPLLKNVMAARKMAFEIVTPAPGIESRLRLESVSAPVGRGRGASCRMLGGDADQQAAALVDLLLEGEAR